MHTVDWITGIREWHRDLVSMFGPPTGFFGYWFGPTGVAVKISWMVISPLILLVRSRVASIAGHLLRDPHLVLPKHDDIR